ncbi:hypothetical protein [Polaribacter sp. Q13]|uniref:hypothetical protein n=1 Tax=Polaribacter sp. Q13 TaxID=2806551 RepID=UPI001C020745|nr:hypothetical protein [Polaribacter sp. Q13]QVY66896.1 hypothetical protein JOP69_06330 [Polaribacter sp. Q13]
MAFALPKNFESLFENERIEWIKIKRIFSQISSEFNISKIRKPSLASFEIMNKGNFLKILQSYEIKKDNNQFTLSVVEYNNSYEIVNKYGGRTATESHKYLFGFLRTEKDFGKGFLRPESIGDKISEYFSPVELDINGFDKFNKNYYLVVSEKDKFLKSINENIINSISEYKNVEMEFSNRKYLFRIRNVFELKEAKNLCELGIKLASSTKNKSA